MHVIDGMVGVVIGLMWGVLLLGLDLSKASPVALLLTILVTTFSTSGLGLLMGCISLITLNVMFINNAVYFALLIFSGANIPIATLTPWMQAISAVLPLTRGIASARLIIAGASLSEVLVRMKAISKDVLLAAISEGLGFPPLNLSRLKIDNDNIRIVPKRMAMSHRMVPISRIGKFLTVAMVDPLNIFAIDDLRTITGMDISDLPQSRDEAIRFLKHHVSFITEKRTSVLKPRSFVVLWRGRRGLNSRPPT